MNKNLPGVIRRYEQERLRNAPSVASGRRETGEPSEPPRLNGAHRRCGAKLPADGRPAGSSLPGSFDAQWMAALATLNRVGLASGGCLVCGRIA